MSFQGRALYNFLVIAHQEDPSIQVEPWQIRDYRSLSEAELFSSLPCGLSSEAFLLYAQSCDTPEELLECVWPQDGHSSQKEKAYLSILELWRRLLPEKKSLSLFGDELDRLIATFDLGGTLEEEAAAPLLRELEDILDSNAGQEKDPKKLFSLICDYTAHDIETFLFDYILDLIEKGADFLATSFIEAFEDYVSKKKWFLLLRAYLLSASEVELAKRLIARLLEEEEENPDPSFLKEVFFFLEAEPDPSLIEQCANQLFPLLSADERSDFFDPMSIGS